MHSRTRSTALRLRAGLSATLAVCGLAAPAQALDLRQAYEAAWARHRGNAERLWSGLESLGLELHVPEPLRLPTLTTVRIPEGVDGKAFSLHLLNKHGIEVGGGLGALAGKVWRIGLMGYNSQPNNVDRLLNLFETELPAFGNGAPTTAAAA